MNRRGFLWILVSSPLALIFGSRPASAADEKLAKGDPAKGKEEVVMITLQDPTASALSYSERAEAAPKAKRTNPKAYCNNCLHYNAAKEITHGGSKVAPCALFQGKYVKSGAWCLSWFSK